jgi:hypothetical protein
MQVWSPGAPVSLALDPLNKKAARPAAAAAQLQLLELFVFNIYLPVCLLEMNTRFELTLLSYVFG